MANAVVQKIAPFLTLAFVLLLGDTLTKERLACVVPPNLRSYNMQELSLIFACAEFFLCIGN